MVRRVSLLLVLVAMVLVFTGSYALADEKNTHEGTFVSMKNNTEFVMKDAQGKEHTHTLATDAKIVGADGKECKLADFKAGQKLRVTTKEGDNKTAVKVEAIR